MTQNIAGLVKDLASAVSIQAQVSNRTWFALMTVSVFTILPRSPNADGNVTLPLNLGSVQGTSFNLVMFALIVVLNIGFSAGYAQQVRAQRLAQRVVSKLPRIVESSIELHPRDLYDVLRTPSVNRVAPIAQLFRNLDDSYSFPPSTGIPRRLGAAIYYVLLKLASWLVFFGFPIIALWNSFSKIGPTGPLFWLLVWLGVIATVPMLHVWLVDAYGAVSVIKVISKSRKPE